MNITLHKLNLSDEAFEKLILANPECSFEQTADGELVVVPPTGGTSSRKNRSLTGQLDVWVESNLSLGEGFDSNVLFVLPSGARRSPDASWIRRDRWESLTPQQQDGYPPICPDFVVELLSPTDVLQDTQAKMQEYIDNGARLGWLIDPYSRQVEIYRSGREKQVVRSPEFLSGEDVLPGFVLHMQLIWR